MFRNHLSEVLTIQYPVTLSQHLQTFGSQMKLLPNIAHIE